METASQQSFNVFAATKLWVPGTLGEYEELIHFPNSMYIISSAIYSIYALRTVGVILRAPSQRTSGIEKRNKNWNYKMESSVLNGNILMQIVFKNEL